MKTDVRLSLGLALIWLAPTLALKFGRLLWHAAAFQIRLHWAWALWLTGNLDAARRALNRLEAEAAKTVRR